jgi:hypothetical protein
LITTILGYWQRWAWTGLETKSAWDWLELLIIPLVLALGALWFNNQSRRRELEQELARRKSEQELAFQARKSEQDLARRERENDREIAQDRVREEALQRYLDRMQELILDKGLRTSGKDAEIRDVARARTLAVLRSLDGNRKGHVVRSLYESNSIGKAVAVREESGVTRILLEAIIDLRTADLSFANLFDAILMGANLNNTNLSNADLTGVNLSFADLTDADLRGADLNSTYLNCTNLSYANLTGAKNWTKEQLAQAKHLDRAFLPDGAALTEED